MLIYIQRLNDNYLTESTTFCRMTGYCLWSNGKDGTQRPGITSYKAKEQVFFLNREEGRKASRET
jgi:hypothetical protein